MTVPNTVVLIGFVTVAAWSDAASVALIALKPHQVTVEQTTYKGKSAVLVTDAAEPKAEGDDDRVAVLTNTSFGDGTIEVEVAAFRIASDISGFECFYLRPTNGRADDQARRNHSVQYISSLSFPGTGYARSFPRSTRAMWTLVRIEVKGSRATLFVNGAGQPTLIVNDLKRGAGMTGAIGLWIGPGTVAHFADLTVDK
jgi:hypothetical protein